MTGEFAEITILRDAGPAAQPTVGLHFYDEIKGQVQMVIDGRIIASATISGGTAIQGPRASALAIAMAQRRHMEVRQNGKAKLGRASCRKSVWKNVESWRVGE